MSVRKSVITVAAFQQNAFEGIRQSIRNLGEDLTLKEIADYLNGSGPSAGYVADVYSATNPLRSKSWHLGRIKYFVEQFAQGTVVDPVVIGFEPLVGRWIIRQGYHRVLAAAFAKLAEIPAQRTQDS